MIIFEQDNALGSRLTHEGTALRQINGLLLLRLWMLKEARFCQQQQQATHACIKRRFLNFPLLNGCEQLLAPPAWNRHLQVKPRIDGYSSAFDRFKPVRDYHP